MYDEIKPTPRNKLLGLLADGLRGGLDFATNDGKNKPMNMLAELVGVTDLQKGAERLANGGSLTTGGGLNTRLNPEIGNAIFSALPFAKPIYKGANLAAEGLNKGAAMFGKAAAPSTDRLVNAVMAKGGLPAQLLQDMAQGTKSPATVWHGSPHKFDAFDSSKIGTGEGAQAYGHGLYLAESPEVAKGYTASTTNGFGLPDGNVQGVANLIANRGEDAARKWFSNLGNDLEPTIAKAKDAINQNSSLYKVDLPDEHIARMLDWDKPLSQQAPDVQSALNGIEKNFSEIPDFNLRKWMDADPLASTWHNILQRDLGADPAMITNTLKERGITGIKYLDGGSRGAGQGSSNYVVFPGNERLLKILERNGQTQ